MARSIEDRVARLEALANVEEIPNRYNLTPERIDKLASKTGWSVQNLWHTRKGWHG